MRSFVAQALLLAGVLSAWPEFPSLWSPRLEPEEGMRGQRFPSEVIPSAQLGSAPSDPRTAHATGRGRLGKARLSWRPDLHRTAQGTWSSE